MTSGSTRTFDPSCSRTRPQTCQTTFAVGWLRSPRPTQLRAVGPDRCGVIPHRCGSVQRRRSVFICVGRAFDITLERGPLVTLERGSLVTLTDDCAFRLHQRLPRGGRRRPDPRLAGCRGQPHRRRRDHQHDGTPVFRPWNARAAAGRRGRSGPDRLRDGRSEWPAADHAGRRGVRADAGWPPSNAGPGLELLRARPFAADRYRVHIAVWWRAVRRRSRHGRVERRGRAALSRFGRGPDLDERLAKVGSGRSTPSRGGAARLRPGCARRACAGCC